MSYRFSFNFATSAAPSFHGNQIKINQFILVYPQNWNAWPFCHPRRTWSTVPCEGKWRGASTSATRLGSAGAPSVYRCTCLAKESAIRIFCSLSKRSWGIRHSVRQSPRGTEVSYKGVYKTIQANVSNAIPSEVNIRKRPRISAKDLLPSALSKSGLVRPVKCDLQQYYRNFQPLSSPENGSNFHEICLSEGMSCNNTCGWENALDSGDTKLLRLVIS